MAATKQLISVEEFLSSPQYERFEYPTRKMAH